MYNQIWSPLKQEFVPTLSTDGRQALKMYINSFKTGGSATTDLPSAEDLNRELEVIKNDINGAKIKQGGDGKDQQINEIITKFKHIEGSAKSIYDAVAERDEKIKSKIIIEEEYLETIEGIPDLTSQYTVEDQARREEEASSTVTGASGDGTATPDAQAQAQADAVASVETVSEQEQEPEPGEKSEPAVETKESDDVVGEDPVDPNKFYKLFFGKNKTHDLGEIPKAYRKEGVFIADFGSSDLKFLGGGGKEDKYKKEYEKNSYFLSDDPEHIQLLNSLFDERVAWDEIGGKNLYIRGGSILKGGAGDEDEKKRMENLLEFIKQWNSKEENAQRKIQEEVIIENAQHDLMGRMNKEISVIKDKEGHILQKLEGGEHIIIGGALSYIHPILKFNKYSVQGTLKDNIAGPVHTFNETVKTFTHIEDNKNEFAKIYYVICYYVLKDKYINENSVVFFGPTGSNPTISVLDIRTGMVQIYEFDKQTLEPYNEEALKQFEIPTEIPNAKSIKITQDLHPKLFKMLPNTPDDTSEQQSSETITAERSDLETKQAESTIAAGAQSIISQEAASEDEGGETTRVPGGATKDPKKLNDQEKNAFINHINLAKNAIDNLVGEINDESKRFQAAQTLSYLQKYISKIEDKLF